MPAKKPTGSFVKDVVKYPVKVELKTCAICKKQAERKPGRVFICFWCGSTQCLGDDK